MRDSELTRFKLAAGLADMNNDIENSNFKKFVVDASSYIQVLDDAKKLNINSVLHEKRFNEYISEMGVCLV
ncbi:hypothetical protein HN903_04105 [archaeon]|nr:hypothetical protein [archaeon]MBT7128913.1 hypothetical protein [archaeon]